MLVGALRPCPEADEVIVGEAEHGAEHSSGEVDVLRGVVDDPQQGDEGADVGCVQEVLPGVGVDRDAPGRQGLGVGRKVAACRQQDAAVLILHRAGGAAIPHRLTGGHHRLDAVGNIIGIRLGGVIGQEAGLHAALILPRRTADKALAVAVGRIAQLRGHELFEEEVDARHHLRGGAEVGVQRQQGVPAGGTLFGAGAGRAAGQGRPALQLLPEDGGVGLPEAVDALLEVAHEEEVVPCRACEAAVKGILQCIGVLIFVHHDGSIALSDALAQLGGVAVLVPQKAEGQMLEVAEFQQPALPLPGRKAGVEVPHSGKKGAQAGFGSSPVQLGLVQTTADQIFYFFKELRGLVGPGLDRVLVLAGEPLFHILESGDLLHAEDVGRQLIVEGRPLPRLRQMLHLSQQGGGAFEPFQRLGEPLIHARHSLFLGGGGLFAGLGVGPRGDEVGPAVLQCGGQQLPRRPGRPGGFGQQDVVPAGADEAVLVLPWGQHLVQLPAVVGQGAEEVIDLQDGLPRRAVGAALAVKVGEGTEIRVQIGRFQRLGEGRSAQRLHAAGVGGGEIGRDVQRLKVLAEQVEAEGVNGTDGGALQKHPLAAEGRVGRLGLTAAEQRLPDAGAKLGGGGIGKGDDEEPVGVHGVLRVGDEPDGPLRQHGGLTAARGGAHQQRTAPVVDGGTLGRGPFCLAHGSFSSFLSGSSDGSKGFAGASRARSPTPSSWQQIKP